MLNTDLHNPHVPRKMSAAQFIKNNRGIDGGEDMPPEALKKVGGGGGGEGQWVRAGAETKGFG